MSKNDGSIKIDKAPKNVEELVTSEIGQVQLIDVFNPETKTIVQTTAEALKMSFYKPPEKTSLSVVYKVVYPDDLNLKSVPGSQKLKNRVGRPKKSKASPEVPAESSPTSQKSKIKVVSKTRSGREVKFPKYIQNDFKKIELSDGPNSDPNDCGIKVTDFVKYTESVEQKGLPKIVEKKLPDLDAMQKKRRIAAQYRCPKCKKAYLGRSKILEHLRKNPSHGPRHQSEENYFEVWNYLVSITQKCPSSERGPKFCQELSNLLHNLLLLTNALFKKLGSAANEVKIDKVLGNAIGLSPGTYYFDDNNLYKDVTVLQLMGNTDFLNSIRSRTDDNLSKSSNLPEKNCNCGKLSTIDELVLKSMLISSEANESIANKINNIKIGPQTEKCANGETLNNDTQFTVNDFLLSSNINLPHFSPMNDYDMKSDLENPLISNNISNANESNKDKKILNESKDLRDIQDKKQILQTQTAAGIKAYNDIKNGTDHQKQFPDEPYLSSNLNYDSTDFSLNYDSNQEGVLNHINIDLVHKLRPKSPKIKIQSNILISPPNPKFPLPKCSKAYSDNNQSLPTKNPVNPELLTDNSALITNLQHTVDELMLPVSSGPNNILDNSSSSDDVINVDQFVNERFRRITEADLEVINSNSLNLELPALELFNFHTT